MSDAQPVILAERERPFWGYAEVFLIAALFLPAVFAGSLVVQIATRYLHSDAKLGLPLLIAQFIGYGIVFLALRILFARYGQPLLKSLAWVPQHFRPVNLAMVGVGLAVAVVLLGSLLHLPNTETPFDKLLNDPVSRIAIAIFGVTFGPVVEELLFRGFLQPVLVESEKHRGRGLQFVVVDVSDRVANHADFAAILVVLLYLTKAQMGLGSLLVSLATIVEA